MGKRVLVCALDWGLGHATRCVPVVRELLRQGAAPALAGSGAAGTVLQEAFPSLPFLPLPSYGIRYPTHNMVWNMCLQVPRIARTVWKEHQQVEEWVRRHHIDGILSDHRYGCFSRQIPAVFITHQLHLFVPGAPLRYLANRLHHYFIRQYDYCWIPDLPAEGNLSGRLSHPPLSEKHSYIGLLSRLEKRRTYECYDLLILLSGPEPQRSRLEALLCEQSRRLPLRVLLVRGRPDEGPGGYRTGRMEVVHYLAAEELSKVLAGSGLVVCRSGYSSLMDLATLGKRAILIPTPGQTEQEYLAKRLFERGVCLYRNQDNLNLEEALEAAAGFPGFGTNPSNEKVLGKTVAEFLRKL